MDCKTTYSKVSPRRGRSGFTLVEMMFAMGITALMVLALCGFSIYSGRNFAAIYNYVELDDANRLAMDILTSDVRQANYLHSATTNYVVLSSVDPLNRSQNGFIVYYYNPTAAVLTRMESYPGRPAVSKILLTGCERLSFNLGQRNLNANAVPFQGLPMNSSESVIRNTAKVLDVSWLCSRKILGIRANTESVQTARVVIRKQGT